MCARRVYKNFDPRAKIIREVAEEVFAIQVRLQQPCLLLLSRRQGFAHPDLQKSQKG